MQALNAVVDAAIRYSSMIGLIIDVLGTLYMAYDLFGQRHGPLRILTETITYVVAGVTFGTAALGVIAYDAVAFDPYFARAVTVAGAISVLISFGVGGGFGAGLGYVLTIERKWHGGNPHIVKDNRAYRLLNGLLVGVFEGVLVYIVMANFRNTHDILSGIQWGALQGMPAGILFGFIVVTLQVRFTRQWNTEDLLRQINDGAIQRATIKGPFDLNGLLSGLATGIAVGPVTAASYFALYGPFVPRTFLLISIAGVIGGAGLGLMLATVERTLLWIDLLPEKRLGIAGAFMIFVGFSFQMIQQIATLAQTLTRH